MQHLSMLAHLLRQQGSGLHTDMPKGVLPHQMSQR